jgi:hypothetical protein
MSNHQSNQCVRLLRREGLLLFTPFVYLLVNIGDVQAESIQGLSARKHGGKSNRFSMKTSPYRQSRVRRQGSAPAVCENSLSGLADYVPTCSRALVQRGA